MDFVNNSAEMAWSQLETDELLKTLHTNIGGLGNHEASMRLNDTGLNELPEKRSVPPYLVFISQFKSPLIYILLVSGVIAFIASDFVDGVVVFAVLLLNAIIGFYQEQKAARSLQSLKNLLSLRSIVIRDGLENEIDARHVVPGDIVLLQAGRKVPADMRLLQTNELSIDESVLSGESTPVLKSAQALEPSGSTTASSSLISNNMALMGTITTAGRGVGVVVATGVGTFLGRLSEETFSASDFATPLQNRIKALSNYIIIVTLVFGIAGFAIGIVRGYDAFSLFLSVVAMAVAVVPEGLPVILTIAFAVSVNRMARNQVIVRYLPAIETLGSSTVIGSDKTGTLTRNEMTVNQIITQGGRFTVRGYGYDPRGEILRGSLQESVPVTYADNDALEWVLRIGLLANESGLVNENGRWIPRGDPTEVALIVSALRGGLDEENENFMFPQIDIVPFDSAYLYMATLHKINATGLHLPDTAKRKHTTHDSNQQHLIDAKHTIDDDSPNNPAVAGSEDFNLVFVKGSTETLLSLSGSILDDAKGVGRITGAAFFNNSNTRPITNAAKDMLIKDANSMADGGLRVLGMALKRVPALVTDITHKDITDLVFVGLQGMSDPPRPDAIESISSAKLSGIKVLMITGDNPQTALSIARSMGIAGENDTVIGGADLEHAGNDELQGIVKTVRVYARVSPHHKLRIVNALKSQGEIVSVTGDGVNDAPALKAAHVGVAMGITGTDVAKEASDIVVLNDSFSNIYRAIIEGRVAFDNIRKAGYFLLSIGFGMLLAIFATIAIGYPLILLPAQILWLNLVTSGLQDIALAFEPKEPDITNRPPRNPSEGFLDRVLVTRVAIVGTTIATLSLGSFLYLLSIGTSIAHARTFALTTIVFCQFFNVLNSRSESASAFSQNPFDNPFLLLSILTSLIAQAALLYLPFMGTVFRNTSLGFNEILQIFFISSLVLFVSEIHKLSIRRRRSISGS
jgi:Ca2+-transporting ATPase